MSNSSIIDSPAKTISSLACTKTPPVIVIGLPRSGSSYVAHVLSCMKGLFVFDDLYPYQKAQALGIATSTNLRDQPDKAKQFIESLTWQLRAKIKYEEHFFVPNLSWDDTFDMEAAIFQALDQDPLFWPQVLEEWSMRLATLSGKNRWGYKTPQDFQHMRELSRVFPDVKFIYIFRDPRKMMLSYKNLPKTKTRGSEDGESGAYHPIIYSLYWKKAFSSVRAFAETNSASVECVNFEELVNSPELVSNRIANFLNTEIEGSVVLDKANSSSNSGRYAKLTNFEVFLCEKIAGSEMKAAGYKLSSIKPKIFDFLDFIATSFRFSVFQARRFVVDRRARVSILVYVKSLFSGRSTQINK